MMNSKIYEIAMKAGFTSWELNPSKETVTDTPEKIKKLVELVAQECSRISLECGINLNQEDFREGISRSIKQHFGVEE